VLPSLWVGISALLILEAIMRNQIVAIFGVILVAFALKLIFFPPPIALAEVGSVKRTSMDISAMHQNVKNLPVEKIHDMTFVFSDGD